MIKKLMSRVREYKKQAIATPLFMVGEVAMEALIPMIMAMLIDRGIGTDDRPGSLGQIFLYGGILLAAAMISLFSGVMSGRMAAVSSAGFARNLRHDMYYRIQEFSFSNIDKYSTSSLVTRLTTDVTNLQNAYQMILRMLVRAPLSMITAMALSFYISKELASIYLVAVLILGFFLFMIMRRAMATFSAIFPKYDELNESVDENVTAIRVVKAFVREDYETEKERRASGNIYQLFKKAESIIVWNGPMMQATVYTCILLISWIGAKMIVSSNQTALTTGDLMSLLTYCMNILGSLMFLSMAFVMITMSQASAKRICEVIEEKSDLVNPENPDYDVPDGSIVYENVSFSYAGGNGEPVLRDINLSINSGETIGIIGGTGSAKTSLVNLLSRLYDVSSGCVKIGGKDVRSYDLETLRGEVAVVLQKNVLFSGTILENLRWGDPDATEEECREACRLACADEFIEKLPEGYNTHIEQGGTNISGGQRQRLCIARALLKHPKIIIFDDSTSAVDTATDARIRKALAECIPDTTKLIIAQRISSVQHADRVIVMDDGRVDGFDTPERLLETNLIYQEVYESQTGGNGDFDEGGEG